MPVAWRDLRNTADVVQPMLCLQQVVQHAATGWQPKTAWRAAEGRDRELGTELLLTLAWNKTEKWRDGDVGWRYLLAAVHYGRLLLVHSEIHNSRESVVYGINLGIFRNRECLGVFMKWAHENNNFVVRIQHSTTGGEKHFCLCTKKKQEADPEGIPVALSMHNRTSSLASSELLVEAPMNSAVRLQFLFCVQFKRNLILLLMAGKPSWKKEWEKEGKLRFGAWYHWVGFFDPTLYDYSDFLTHCYSVWRGKQKNVIKEVLAVLSCWAHLLLQRTVHAQG